MEERKCMFCGCDISHLRANAKICGSRECKNAYNKWRQNKSKEPRFCEVCGKPIDDLPGQRRICLDPECEKEQKRRKYKTSLKEKVCTRCGEVFLGTAKQTLCENCRNHPKQSDETFEQIIVCEKCGKQIGVCTKKVHSKANSILAKGICDECKQENYLKASIRMTENNPMFNKETQDKVSQTKHQQYVDKCSILGITPIINNHKRKGEHIETKEETRERMKLFNPMFNKETVEKMKNTLKQHIEDGTVVYKKGKEHPLWKGNRNFNRAVRIELRNWVKTKFEKVGYKCEKCGKTHTELQVHHLEPLRDIILKFMNINNVNIDWINDNMGTQQCQEIIEQIKQYHYEHPEIGIVVCPDCHCELDSYYKRKTHENKKNK